jgi:acetyltransferase-like isoleucine patch superfamily enzyme
MINKALLTVNRILGGLASRRRNLYYRLLGVNLQGYVWLREIEIPRNYQEIELEDGCALDQGVVLLCSGKMTTHPKIYIGAGTYLNRGTFLDAAESIRIGRNCAIGPRCYITDHDHGVNPNLPPLDQPLVTQSTQISDSAWVGANVTILKGVTIGAKAVIGAGSVVTKDIPAGTVAVGVPAKVIKANHPTLVNTNQNQQDKYHD